MPTETMFVFTRWYSERDVVLLTEAFGKDGMRRRMVAKPVRTIVSCGAINTNHQVAV